MLYEIRRLISLRLVQIWMIMDINRDACTFCMKEPTEVPKEITAYDAHGAMGLKYLIFCEDCNSVLRKYHMYYENFTKGWAGHLTADNFEKKLKEQITYFIEDNSDYFK